MICRADEMSRMEQLFYTHGPVRSRLQGMIARPLIHHSSWHTTTTRRTAFNRTFVGPQIMELKIRDS